MTSAHIPLADAGPVASDVMLTDPDTHPPSTTVAEARAVFASPRKRVLVIADGTRYLGAVTRESVEGRGDDETLDGALAPAVPTMDPSDPSARVPELVAAAGLTRIPVVDGDGRLHGLVCFDQAKAWFCVS